MHGRLAALIRAAALAALLGSSVLVGRGEAGPDRTKGDAKNVIFMMGDGMGPAHRDAIQLATVGPYDRLAMGRLPVEGMVRLRYSQVASMYETKI
jgi:alkaline phosphatase